MSAAPVATSNAATAHPATARVVAHNLRRLMALYSLTYDEVVEAAGLDHRTVRAIARAEKNAHARTLRQLAEGLGVAVEELFVDAGSIAAAGFDEATNPIVSQVIESHAALFEGWSAGDFAELHSRFGHGGELNEEGTIRAAEAMNRKREVVHKARVVLESSDGPLLEEFVRMLYDRVQKTE